MTLSTHRPNLKPTAGSSADAGETEALVQPKGRLVPGVDIADELAIAGAGAGIDQGRQQGPADPAIHELMVNIDRVLQRVAIGRALAERHGISVADDDAVDLRDEMRQAAVAHVLAPPPQILAARAARLVDADIAEPGRDMMVVDRQHGGDVGLGRGADENL